MLEVNRINSKQAVFFQNAENPKKYQESRKKDSSDSMDISREGMEMYRSAGKQLGFHEEINDISRMGKEAWEKAAGMKVWGYLESTNIDGTEPSVFQKHQKSQYIVFQEYLEKNNAFENMSEDEKNSCIATLKDITGSMDHFGETTGYNGISEESVVLLENMNAQLSFFNEKYVPESLQKDFSGLIGECSFFNQNSREKMFADTMPADMMLEQLTDGAQNIEKNEIIEKHLSYCRDAKDTYQQIFESVQKEKGAFALSNALSRVGMQYGERNGDGSTNALLQKLTESWKRLF